MQLLTILFTIGLAHLWGSDNPLHQDAWFRNWLDSLARKTWAREQPRLFLLLGLGLPCLVLLIGLVLLGEVSRWLLLPAGVVVLLYSLGRHDQADLVDIYTSACARDDWHAALEQARELGVDCGGLTAGDWENLHGRVLDAAAYQAFERLFAVLFWFALLGPVGALLYRLSRLVVETPSGIADTQAREWLWLFEWPAVRLLGLSMAVTGNFVGCLGRWRECLLSPTLPSARVLGETALGALAVDEQLRPTCAVTRRELMALQSLYTRTFWLWLGAIAIWGIWR